MIAGVLSPEGRQIVSTGHRAKGDARQISGNTEFEIGSVGKAFTALLLADMVLNLVALSTIRSPAICRTP